MSRIHFALLAVPLAIFQFGCAESDRIGEDTSNSLSAMMIMPQAKAPPTPGNPGVYGTWKNETEGVGRFNTLVLMTDGRYHSARTVVCIKAPCDPIEESGKFELYNRDGGRFIALTANGAEDAQRFEYVSKPGLLQLRHILPGSDWYSMHHGSPAWCEETRDCGVQVLPPGPCAGGYTCSQSQCAWQCGGGGEQAMN